MVDNASEDDTVEFLKKHYPEIKIVKNKKNMGYVGMNSALPFCKGKYVYFNNNDLTLDKDCLVNMIEAIEKDDSIAMVTFTVKNYYNRKLVSGGTWVSRSLYCGHFLKTDDRKEVEIHSPAQAVKVLTESDTLDGGTVLEGFSLAVKEIFPQK